MTNATTGIPQFPLSTSETTNHISEIMKSDSTQVGELLRGHLGLDWVNDGDVLALAKLMNTFIYVSDTGSERFFINEEKGPEISFFQLIEFHHLKEKFPDADLSFLFKSKTYSFYHVSYEAIHDFFETLLSYGVCFTVKKIELVIIDTTVRAALPLYAVEFESTERLSTFQKVLPLMTVNSINSLSSNPVNLDQLKDLTFESEDECLAREEHELRIAVSDALAKRVESAMGIGGDGEGDMVYQNPPPL